MNDARNFNEARPEQPSPELIVCLGTRPEIIKMAPVIRALGRRGVHATLLHTGQHNELAWPLYDYFGLAPDIELDRHPEDHTLARLSASLLSGIDQALDKAPPRMILVHGDTTSAAMAALAAFYRNIPVAHVEAGLRSHRLDDPFPEELNRSLIARIAHWHFAPTEGAVRNLYREGITPEKTFLVGNTVIDASRQVLERLARERQDQAAPADVAEPALPRDDEAANPSRRMVLVTIHRRENWGDTVAGLARALTALAQAHPELELIWPLHANPVLADAVREQFTAHAGPARTRCHLLPPLDYPELIELLSRAWLVITDSGGLQEESCALGVPVLVTRQGTERPELIEVGAGRLIGTDPLNLIREFEALWRDPAKHQSMRSAINPFGDGHASERIATVIAEWLREASTDEAVEQGAHRLHHARAPARTSPRSMHSLAARNGEVEAAWATGLSAAGRAKLRDQQDADPSRTPALLRRASVLARLAPLDGRSADPRRPEDWR
jgi:UDP-N-acetylglucosamine 2-epimerase